MANARLHGLTISVHPGEVYPLLGLNGAGKSTTIRMLLGVSRPTRGQALLFGQPIRHGAGPWNRVGYLDALCARARRSTSLAWRDCGAHAWMPAASPASAQVGSPPPRPCRESPV